VSQIPCVPSHAITVHKVQAATLDGVIVGPLRGPGAVRNPPRTALYVAASRVRRGDALAFAWRPQQQDLDHFRPPKSLEREMERLNALARATVLP